MLFPNSRPRTSQQKTSPAADARNRPSGTAIRQCGILCIHLHKPWLNHQPEMTLKIEYPKIDVLRLIHTPFHPHSKMQSLEETPSLDKPIVCGTLEEERPHRISSQGCCSHLCWAKLLFKAASICCHLCCRTRDTAAMDVGSLPAGENLQTWWLIILFPTMEKAIWRAHPPFSNTPISFNILQSHKESWVIFTEHFTCRNEMSSKLAGVHDSCSKKRSDSDAQHFSNPRTFSNSQSYRAVIVDKSSWCSCNGGGFDDKMIKSTLSYPWWLEIPAFCWFSRVRLITVNQ